MLRVLFICSQNKLRSPTAEAVFAGREDLEVDSAGLNHDAIQPLDAAQVRWAQLIFVMEPAHRNKLNAKYRKVLTGKQVICLNIPDDYDFMDPALVALLEVRVTPHLTRSLRSVSRPAHPPRPARESEEDV